MHNIFLNIYIRQRILICLIFIGNALFVHFFACNLVGFFFFFEIYCNFDGVVVNYKKIWKSLFSQITICKLFNVKFTTFQESSPSQPLSKIPSQKKKNYKRSTALFSHKASKNSHIINFLLIICVALLNRSFCISHSHYIPLSCIRLKPQVCHICIIRKLFKYFFSFRFKWALNHQ